MPFITWLFHALIHTWGPEYRLGRGWWRDCDGCWRKKLVN